MRRSRCAEPSPCANTSGPRRHVNGEMSTDKVDVLARAAVAPSTSCSPRLSRLVSDAKRLSTPTWSKPSGTGATRPMTT